MNQQISFHLGMSIFWVVLACLMLGCPNSQEPDPKLREQIGEVLSKPVYRDQTVLPETNDKPKDEQLRQLKFQSHLRQLFLAPVVRKFQQEHQSELAPTEAEIKFAQAYFKEQHRKRLKENESETNAQLKEINEKLADTNSAERKTLELRKQAIEKSQQPLKRSFAEFMLRNLKWQRYLFDHFGGGRALFQQGGTEAFDATRKWIEEMERQGEFKISDPELRTAFYGYWTTWNHGSFLTDDPQRIRDSLTAPPWMAQ